MILAMNVVQHPSEKSVDIGSSQAALTPKMTPLERRASLSLAAVFALRMLGLFLVLPVFAIEAQRYPGGDDAARVGLAMGVFGLTQALLQIPYGMASDRFGRKPVILLGMFVFLLGSIWAALATNLDNLLIGRALQGAGAISAAVTALLADFTRPVVRTKGMALVGASIGVMFALSLVAAPVLVGTLGLSGLFTLMAGLIVAGMGLVVWAVPPAPQALAVQRTGFAAVLRHPALWRLNVGVFALHAAQLAMWMAVPGMLVAAGLIQKDHWQVYLPGVILAFALTGGVFAAERRGYLMVLIRASIGLLIVVQIALAFFNGNLVWMGGLMFLFFMGFNALEATQPSLVSRFAPASQRGAALGVYNTLQSLGFFAGGALGGWLAKSYGYPAVFAFAGALLVIWLLATVGMPVPAAHE